MSAVLATPVFEMNGGKRLVPDTEEEESYHYETVELGEMQFVAQRDLFRYECPCGDWFEISAEEILNGSRVAQCPTCSLTIWVTPSRDVSGYLTSLGRR
mmetsp:Transcript_1829/g.2486  ORF Transcript_1829/g.2486 Transcript_1829/m.2486 type:complete len:99 (+) Transcript_1829:42-338(+)